MTMHFRTLAGLAAVVFVLGSSAGHAAQRRATATPIAVYKSPTCGCCSKWVEYMSAHGFKATTTNMDDVTPIKKQHRVPAALHSCHTALVGGYVIEGHVPAEDVRRLLRERPAIVGLAAPGMPAGSPGMDVPNSPAYDVIAFDAKGGTRVFATHR